MMAAGEGRGPAKDASRRKRWRFDLRRDGLRAAAFLVVLLLVNFAFWFVAVRPRQAEIALLRETKQTADATEAQARRQLEELRRVHRHAMEVQEGIRVFFEEMLSTRQQRLVPFQRALTSVGEEFGVEPRQVGVSVETLAQEGIEVMTISFPIQGGYENLRHLLARLEALDQFLIVREVSLRGSDRGGRELQLNVAVETYFNAPWAREEEARLRAWKKKARTRRGSRSRRRR